MVYTTLVLSGGGAKGIIHLGVLQQYYEKKLLQDIKIGVGTSVGTIILYLLFIGYTPSEIFMESQLFDFQEFKDITDINIGKLLKNSGMINIDILIQKIDYLSVQKIGYSPSLSELYELTGKELIVTTYNLTRGQSEYKSYHTDPDINCLDAIRLSCNIPIVFYKCIYDKCVYIDGAFIDNFPIEWTNNYVNSPETIDDELDTILKTFTITDNKKNILGINIISDIPHLKANCSLLSYILSIFSISFKENKVKSMKYDSPYVDVVTLKADGGMLELSLDIETKLKYFKVGYECKRTEVSEERPDEVSEERPEEVSDKKEHKDDVELQKFRKEKRD